MSREMGFSILLFRGTQRSEPYGLLAQERAALQWGTQNLGRFITAVPELFEGDGSFLT